MEFRCYSSPTVRGIIGFAIVQNRLLSKQNAISAHQKTNNEVVYHDTLAEKHC